MMMTLLTPPLAMHAPGFFALPEGSLWVPSRFGRPVGAGAGHCTPRLPQTHSGFSGMQPEMEVPRTLDPTLPVSVPAGMAPLPTDESESRTPGCLEEPYAAERGRGPTCQTQRQPLNQLARVERLTEEIDLPEIAADPSKEQPPAPA